MRRLRAVVPAVLLLLATAACSAGTGSASAEDTFPLLAGGERVLDETGTSLDAGQAAELRRMLDELPGADAVVYVRELDADPDDTFDQVEALQQQWAARPGGDEDVAVAILVNRQPGDPTEARAGLFVGRTFDDGDVPPGEAEEIVDDAIIPPLRDGDVYGGLAAGVERLGDTIRFGPTQNGFERWAAGATWLPWAAHGVAAAILLIAFGLFQGRRTARVVEARPSTRRPGDLPPVLAGALALGSVPSAATQAVLLDLAVRGALAVEPVPAGGMFSSPRVQIRLLDRGVVRDDVERAVWENLEEHAEGDVVSGTGLQQVTHDGGAVSAAVREQLVEAGWYDPGSVRPRVWLGILAAVGGLALIAALVLGAAADADWPLWVGVVGLGVAAVVAVLLAVLYPPFSEAGQKAAVPWRAYRAGLEAAAKDEKHGLDLDVVLPDAVAMDLGPAWGERADEAAGSGQPLRLFAAGRTDDAAHVAAFPWWVAFTGSMTTGSSGGTVSGGGAGGGGGAAGST